jgi:hypothetical protein
MMRDSLTLLAAVMSACANVAVTAQGGTDAERIDRAKHAPWPPPRPSAEVLEVLSSRTMFRIQPVRPLVATQRDADCTLSGSVEAVRIPLFLDESSVEPFAFLERGEFAAVEVPGSFDGVVRARMAWPLSSSVVVHQDSRPFALGKSLVVAPPVAWLGSGARVAARRSGSRGTVQILRLWSSPEFKPASFEAQILGILGTRRRSCGGFVGG